MTKPSLSVELQVVVERAVSPVLNKRLGSSLPALYWNVGSDVAWSGMADGDDEEETRHVVHEWAAALGQDAVEQRGILQFQHQVDNMRINVWGIVDRELFEKGWQR